MKMPALLIAFGCLTATSALAAPSSTDTKKSPLLANLDAIVAQGCDLNVAHVRTPIEARALRNLPYAKQGYVFKSPELTALYAADGGWYAPNPAAKPVFNPKEGACIKALKDHEATLRKTMPWSTAWEAQFTGMHAAVVHLRQSTKLLGKVTYTQKTGDGNGTGWTIGGADCKGKPWSEAAPCHILQLYCNTPTGGELECGVNAPG